MAEHRDIRSLGFEREGEPFFFHYEEGPPGEGEVRLETLYSGFSAGTELTFMKNTNPYLHSRWDERNGVFVAGEPSARFPAAFLGYMEVARVTESHSPGHRAGDLVASTYAHKSGHIADPRSDILVDMPRDIDPILGIFVAQMGSIAANGILHADAEMFGASATHFGCGIAGRPALVWGGGTVGLLTALFARMAGAREVVVAEPSAYRRAIAEKLGLAALPEDEAWRYAKDRWHDNGRQRGAAIVFQTRARSGSLHLALRALRPQGTIIDLAFYQGGADGLRLGEEFHHNGLTIRCAQINRVPPQLAFAWDRRRLAAQTIDLLRRDGDAIARAMITHVVPIDDAPDFLRDLIGNRPEFLQIVFKFAA